MNALHIVYQYWFLTCLMILTIGVSAGIARSSRTVTTIRKAADR